MTDFIYDGERLVQVSQIESVSPSMRESVGEPEHYGDRPDVVEIETRTIRTISGAEYVSDGSFLEIVDLLMSVAHSGEEQLA